jgi:hypothetical protein
MNKLILLTLLFLTSCAHHTPKTSAPVAPPKPVVVEKKAPEAAKSLAIFHIIEPLGLELVIYNVVLDKVVNITMDKTLSQIELEPGPWVVSGFILSGVHYKLMNAAQQFSFTMKEKKNTYVGSYIFQCPKVNKSHLPQMKKMNFFNRYPFSSETSLCEMVVGSDYKNVKKVWLKLSKTKVPSLSLGF